MPDLSDATVQGLLLAQPITIDETFSSYTEKSPVAGLPTAERATRMVMVPGGTPTGTADLQVRVQHGGTPGQVDQGPTIAVRRVGETFYYGWEQPGVIAGYEEIVSPSGADLENPTVAALSDGTLVVVAELGAGLRSFSKAPGASSWTDDGAVEDRSGVAAVDAYFPCLVPIDSELFLLAWTPGHAFTPAVSGRTNGYYIGVWRSLDSGASWERVQYAATKEADVTSVTATYGGGAGSYYAGRIRAAYREGQIVVLADVTEQKTTGDASYIRQWAGASLTQRLDLVSTMQGASAGWARPDVVATSSGFSVAWLADQVGARTAILGSAWHPLDSADLGTVTLPYDIQPAHGWTVPTGTVRALEPDDTGEVALTWDPSGVLWMYLAVVEGSPQGNGSQYAYYSADFGLNWTPGHASYEAATDHSGHWWLPHDLSGADQQNHPITIAATWHRGRTVIVSDWESAVGGANADNLSVCYLGGWTDLVLPYEQDGILLGDRVGYLRTWVPQERWQDQNYTMGQAGTYANTLIDGAEQVTTGDGAGLSGQSYAALSGSDNGTLMHGGFEWVVAVTATQGNGTQTQIGGRMRLAGATHGVEVEVNLTTTGIYIRDLVAATALGNVTGLTGGTYYAVRLGMSLNSDTGADRNLQVWYRLHDNDPNRRWTLIGKYTLADDAGAGGVVPHFHWGHVVSSGSTTQNDSSWRSVQFFMPFFTSQSIYGTGATWHDLVRSTDYPYIQAGRPIGSAQIWTQDGFTIAGRRGPGMAGDSWLVPVTGEYDVGRAISLTTPSSRIHTRTVDTSTDAVYAWKADPTSGFASEENTRHPPVMGLHIWGNFRLATLEYKTAGGGWSTAATIDKRVISAANYTRVGRTIQATDALSDVYLVHGEAEGWVAEWGTGPDLRYITENTEGRYTNASGEPKARLYIESVEALDATAGGTLNVWSDRATAIVRNVVDAVAWRLTIDSTHTTVDTDYRVSWVWGPIIALARRPSWGRGITQIPNHERVELEGDIGVGVQRGPPGSELRIAWDEGIDETQIKTSGEPATVNVNTAGEQVAALAGTPGTVVTALRAQQERPVVYLPRIVRGSSGSVVLLRPSEHQLATVASAPNVEVVLGDPSSTEVQRIGTVLLRSVD